MGTREGEWSSINLPRAIEQFDASYESAASGVYRTIESIRPNNRGAKEATRSFLPSFLPRSCAPSLENNEEETAGISAKHRDASTKIECGGKEEEGGGGGGRRREEVSKRRWRM